VPEENFGTSWCKARLTEADTPTIRLGGTPSGLSSAHLHHPPIKISAENFTSAEHFKIAPVKTVSRSYMMKFQDRICQMKLNIH